MTQQPRRPGLHLSAPVAGRACAALAVAVAGWFLWESLPFVDAATELDIGPGGVPALVAGLIAIAALFVAWQARRASPILVQEPARVGMALLLLPGFVLGLACALNAWLVTGLFILALQCALGERRVGVLVPGTLALTFVTWLVFGWALDVPL